MPDRTTYRMYEDARLIEDAKYDPNRELAIALGERLDDVIRTTEIEIEQQRERATGLELDANQLDLKIEDLENKIEDLENKIEDLENKIEELELMLADRERIIDELKETK